MQKQSVVTSIAVLSLSVLATGGFWATTARARQDSPAPSKPPLISRGVTTDGKGELGYETNNGYVPDFADLRPAVRSLQARAFERDARGLPSSASGWANRGLAAVQNREYDKAADAFAHAADLYDVKGDPDTAIVMRVQGDRYRSELNLFYNRRTNLESVRRYDTGRRLEPVYGTYIGAFIDRDEELTDTFPDGNRIFKDCSGFNEKIGRKHAAFFTYNGYGSEIPDGWFANLKENTAAAQWVIEPRTLDEIQDDAKLHSIAEAARDAGIPIFVRFASEMNGSWTPYHAPAALYKEKFRLVARVFHATAPNVAMVWCPNNMPEKLIADYYPGEDAADWVGVNFYSPYFNDNNTNRPVWWRNPADNLDFIYRKYAAKHPILIGEWAASHQAKADGVIRTDFAVNKVGQLYSAIPRKYPRVKAVFWFDMNAIKYAGDPGRRINDYSLLSEPKIAAQYQQMISSGYYLDTTPLGSRATASEEIAPLNDRTPLSGSVTFSAWAKTYEERPEVTYSVGGKTMKAFTVPGAYQWTLDTTTLPNGPVPISISMRDSQGHVAASRTVTVLVQNGGGAKPAPQPVPPTPKPIKKVANNTSKPKPAPTPKPVKTTEVSLSDALAAMEINGEKVAMALTPDTTPLTLTDQIRFRVSVGDDGYLFLVLHSSDGSDILLQPRRKSLVGGDLSGARVENGDTVAVPTDPARSLRPDGPGKYTVRALLFSTPEAARAFAAAFAGDAAPDIATLQSRLRTAHISASEKVYGAQLEIEVVSNDRDIKRGVRKGDWQDNP